MCVNDVCGEQGQPCSYNKEGRQGTNLSSYHCLCLTFDADGNKQQVAATGDEDNLECPELNECHLSAYDSTDNSFWNDVTDESDNGKSMFMHRPACERCATDGLLPSGNSCTQTYDAGLVCINNDLATSSTPFDCRCPLGSTLIQYTSDYLTQLDEENDQEVNGVIDTTSLPGWAYDSNNDEYQVSFTVGQGNAVPVFATPTYFIVKFDALTETWSSDIPYQCVEFEKCPSIFCPDRSAAGVACTDNQAYPAVASQGFNAGRSELTFFDLANQNAVLNGVIEGLPECSSCDNSKTQFDLYEFECVDVDECEAAGLTDAAYDNFLAAMVACSSTPDSPTSCGTDTTAYNTASNSVCGANSPATAHPDSNFDEAGKHLTAQCVNGSPTGTFDGYTCECPEGSELKSDGTECVDIKECDLGLHNCGNQQCIDYCMHGSSDGSIAPGTYLSDGTCSFGGGITNTYSKPGGGYTCFCPSGLEWSHEENDCVDINECDDPTNVCNTATGVECVNTHSSFVCACKEGFFDQTVFDQFKQADGSYKDPTECEKPTDCDKDSLTQNGDYFKNNECSSGNECTNACYDADGNLGQGLIPGHNCHDCHSNGKCTQLDEGFECSCPINSSHDGKDKCNDGNQCGPGLAGTLDCEAKNLTCNELDVGYECTCPGDSGYELDSATGECKDIDECAFIALDDNPCGQNGACINTDGGYNCQCFNGYELGIPGGTLVALPAGAMKSLRTSVAGRSPPGIVQDSWQIFAINQETSVSRLGERSDQFTCVDIDECQTGDNICVLPEDGGVCANNDGSYACSCADGFTGDGFSIDQYNKVFGGLNPIVPPFLVNPSDYTGCTDQNECEMFSPCDEGETCTNTPGSYTCSGDDGPGGGTDPTVPTNNCAGLGSICDHAACDDEVEMSCTRTTCNLFCSNGEAINMSQVSCVDTGKLKKQGWRNGKKVVLFFKFILTDFRKLLPMHRSTAVI